jgi:predicted aspartyl protease
MKGLSHAVLSLAAFLLVSEVLLAAESLAEVPFRLYRGYTIVVKGSIGELDKLNFLVDTGAVPSVVDQRMAKKLRLAGQTEILSVFTQSVPVQRVVLPELRLGPLQVPHLSVLVRDLSFIEDGLGVRIDALIGLDVLGRSSFSIDYEATKISFGPVKPSGSAFALEFGPGFVYATLSVQGQPIRLLVDTGAKDLILFESRVHGKLAGFRNQGGKTSSNMGGEASLQQVLLSEARLGNTDLETLNAFLLDAPAQNVPGFDGLLGVRSLGLTRLSFDFERQTISWQK